MSISGWSEEGWGDGGWGGSNTAIWFGDIAIPWVTSIDTSITKDVVEKNFVDKPPKVYELTSNLESGPYSFILNETVHPKNETFEEQKDAVLSMVQRHGTEFPFEVAENSGYILVESATTTDFPSLEIREAEVQVRFLETDTYYSAVQVKPGTFRRGDFDTEAFPSESFIALPSGVNVDGDTSDYQISSDDSSLDLYLFDSEGAIEFAEKSDDVQYSQQNAVCRAFDSSDNRLYSDAGIIDNGSYVSNALVRATYQSSQSTIEIYNGSWETLGAVSLPFNDGYCETNTNDEVNVRFINKNEASIKRGFSAVEYTFSGETSFDFTPNNSFTEQSVNSYYSHYQDGNGNDIVLVRYSDAGDFYSDSTTIGIQNLTSTDEYSVHVGVVPDAITPSDYARYLYNYGMRQRTFTQK